MTRYSTYSIIARLAFTLALAALLCSCFTGVEGTKKITGKDVKKAYKGGKGKYGKGDLALYTVNADTFPNWEAGKTFYVTDDNLRHILSPNSPAAISDTSLKGGVISYQGYIRQMSVDGNLDVSILFVNSQGQDLTIPTGRTMDELTEEGFFYSIPFLIDLDEVAQLKAMLTGMRLYVRTPLWYDQAGDMVKGRKFVRVEILDVTPGSDLFPYMVKFTDGQREAYLYMSSTYSSVRNRSLVDLFSINDIHDLYPQISDENWQRIINEELALDMTKEECRLSVGEPKNIDRRTTISGLRESWAYENGMYLIFEDGLLRRFRR